MRISDWSSDVCLPIFSKLPPASVAFGIGIFNIGRQLSGLIGIAVLQTSIDHDLVHNQTVLGAAIQTGSPALAERIAATTDLLVSRGVEASAAAKTATAMVGRAVGGQGAVIAFRSEEHTSELQSLMRITYAGFCL